MVGVFGWLVVGLELVVVWCLFLFVWLYFLVGFCWLFGVGLVLGWCC